MLQDANVEFLRWLLERPASGRPNEKGRPGWLRCCLYAKLLTVLWDTLGWLVSNGLSGGAVAEQGLF